MRMHRRAIGAAAVWMTMTLILTGCTSEASNIGVAKDKDGKVVDTGFTVSTVGSFDSADTAVVLATDLTNKAVSLINMDTGKQYTLYYDGTTYVKDKYDGSMTISQIKEGDVVDVTFLKGKKKLASIKLSPDAWIFDEIDNYDLVGANKTASIGSKTYSLPDSVVVLSEGRRMEAGEVMAQDVVTISGINHKIYSVKVDRGHGYLRLKNDQPLLGGWIEVGNRVIRQITEDMLLVVPEGRYQVALSNNGVGCVKEIIVERNKEIVLDVGDVEIAEDKTGTILFDVTPATAKVSVDGKPVDISKAVEMRYGIHQVQVEASGYDTLTKYIQVGSEYATISFKLEESRKDNNRDSVSNNTTDRLPWQDTLSSVNRDSLSENTLSTLSENALGTSNNNKVYIDSPKGVEVYLDGNYIGLSPVKFTKSPGRHEITLRKSGYVSKSYTIYLANDKKDETYSFSDLEKEGASNTTAQFPSNIINAIEKAGENCTFISGEHAYIPPENEKNIGNLTDSGKDVVKQAVTDAVKVIVGTEGIGSYSFKVADTLQEVTEREDGNYEGLASVTVTRSGYQEKPVPVKIVIQKGETVEPPLPEDSITVEVSASKDSVKPGDTVVFTAKVQNDGSDIDEAEVVWGVEGNEADGTKFGEDGQRNVLTISSEETADSIKVTATYTDEDGKSYYGSESVSILQESKGGGGGNEGGNPTSTSSGSLSTPENQGAENTNPNTGETDIEPIGLEAETFSIEQEAHPIRDFFSSLFGR